MNQRFSGIGMTSQRTRARMVERLRTLEAESAKLGLGSCALAASWGGP